MKSLVLIIITIVSLSNTTIGSVPKNYFMQGNNIHTCFRTDGIFNYDWVTFPSKEAGLIWPASSPTRKTIGYTAGIWIGAKVGTQRELRLAACAYSSHFTPGNIPVVGQPSPQSVCNDNTWRGYLVQLTDPTLVNGGIRTKTAGGIVFTYNYDAWGNWPVSKGAPFVEVNGMPGYQPGWNSDRPGIGNGSKARPDELLFMVYMDYTNCTNNIHVSEISLPGGTLPLGVEIQQLSFMFNCPDLEDMYFIKWKIINKSQYNWDSVYFTFFDDNDIGAGTCGASDDGVGCDTLRNMGHSYNNDNNDCNYGLNPPAFGYRLLQSPLKFTGNSSDTAKLPYDTLIGYKLIGLTGFFKIPKSAPDPCFNDPDNAWSGYNFMRGMDGCGRPLINPFTHQPTTFTRDGDACNRIGWIDTFANDVRDLMNSGPNVMNILDTQIVTCVYVIGYGSNNYMNVCNVMSESDTALKYYYNDFQTCVPIGIHPISNEVPEKFALYQNYPNPFNPVTKIRFSIPPVWNGRDRSIQLKVYDILGREIATLVNEQLQAGIYEVEWNAENFPSGVYFYIITAGNFTQTRKMVLMK